MKKITKEAIEKMFDYDEQLKPLTQKVSDNLLQIKDNNKDNKIKTTREGKEVEIKESALWTEVHYNAPTNARELLKEKYKDFFDLVEQQEKLKEDMIKHSVTELGINPEQITLTNLVSLIMGIIEYDKSK